MCAFRLHPATLAATCLLVFAGCGGVEFDHPLSDEKTSEVDARLIGFWELVPASVGEEEPDTGERRQRIAVGKSAAVPTFMEAVSMEIKDGVVSVDRVEVRATRIGDHRYLCLFHDEEDEDAYFVVRYELVEEDRLTVGMLDEKVLAKAVEAGELKGEVKGSSDGDRDALTVRVTTATAEVRAWIEAHADTCVKAEGLTMRRLVEKEKGVETSERPDEEDDAEDDE